MTFILGIILGGVAVIFALQNFTVVTVSFLGWSFEGSLALIVLVALCVGLILSVLFSLPSFIDNALEQSRLKRHNEKLKRELEETKIEAVTKPETVVVEKTTVIEKTNESNHPIR